MGKNTPAAPDFSGAAEAQGQASQQNLEQQTWANRPNVYTPFGAQTWESSPTWDPVSGQWINQWSQNTNLAQPLQDAATSQMNVTRDRSQMAEGLLGGAAQQVQQGVDWNGLPQAGGGIASSPLMMNANLSGAPAIPGGPQAGQLQRSLDFGGAPRMPDSSQVLNQRGIDAAYGQYASRLDPQWSQREEQMQSQLLNQGLRPGTEAYDQAMANFGQQRNDAYQSALNQSVLQGAQIGGQMFGQDLSARQQGVNEIGQQGAFFNNAGQQAFNQGLAGAQYGLQAHQVGANDAFQQAAFQNQAAGQDLNMQQQQSAYQNQLRQQQLAEQMQRQGWNLNLINSALSGQQVGMPQMPGFSNAGMAQAPNYLGAAQMQYGAGLDAYNAQQAQMQGLMQGGASMAAPFMF